MPVHDLLRELVETRGAGVVADADQFRGALDDFLDEHEASRGEINLLVDAVRLGAVTRLVAMLDHGAEPSAALDEVAVGLARDRGADSATGARWALGVIGHALGKIEASHLTADRPSSIPAPPVVGPSPARDAPMPEATHPAPPPAPRPPPPGPPPEPQPEAAPEPPAAPVADPAPRPAPEPEAPRPPAPPTDVADGGPPRPGTMTIPDLATERVPDEPPPFTPPPPPPPSPQPGRRGRGRPVAIVAALLLVAAAGVVGTVLLTQGADDDPAQATDRGSDGSGGSAASSSPRNPGGSATESTGSSPTDDLDAGGSLPATSVVLPVTDDGGTGLYVFDLADETSTQLTPGPNDRLPSISPDRTTVVFLRPDRPGTGLRAPIVLDLATGEERPLFTDTSPCIYATRPAWSPAGDRLAITCADENGDNAGSFVVGLDGQEQATLALDGSVDGGLTWLSESVLVYARSADSPGGPTSLWRYDLGDDTSVPLTSGPGFDTHPDWSEENGVVLFQRSTEDGPDVRGDLWTVSPTEGETKLEIGRPVAHGALSADGSLLLFLVDTDDGEQLASAPYADPSDVTVYDQMPGEPGAPAGGPL